MADQKRTLSLLHSVRAKLLLVLAVLSLPLLVVSLVQLNNYRRDLSERATVTARLEVAAAAGSLFSWLESHPAYAKNPSAIAPDEIEELYARLHRDTSSDSETLIAVFDAGGRAIKNSPAAGAGPSP